jgi:nucleotide-binding universal stress UspA family protein
MHYATLTTDMMAALEKQLEHAKEAALAAGASDVQTLMPMGAPAREIVETARAEHCDLIVVGAQGSTGMERMFLGSTAERVVRSAHCPVLTVQAPPQSEASA